MARPRITHERRRQILDSAGTVIAERGVAEARITDVAARIGLSPSLILYYFDSKDDLFVAALAHYYERFSTRIAAAEDDDEPAIRRLQVLIGESSYLDNEWALWLEMWAAARRQPHLAGLRQQMDDRYRKTIEDIVRDGIDAGEFAEIDAERFSIQLSALIDGLAIQVMLGDARVTLETMREMCVSFAEHELDSSISVATATPPQE